MSSVTARILQNVLSPSVRHLPLVLLALPTFDLRELLEYPLIRQFSHVQVWFLLLLVFHVQQFQLIRVSVCDSLQTVLVSASSEASVGHALVPVSCVPVPVLSVSIDKGVYVPAAPTAPVCTSVSVQVPRFQDSSVLVQASGIASSKSSSSSSSSSVNVPVCTVPKFCVSVVPASGDKSVCSSRPFCDTDYVFLHERVHASGFLNYVSCRLSVPSRLNIPLWRQYLHDYHDPGFVTF